MSLVSFRLFPLGEEAEGPPSAPPPLAGRAKGEARKMAASGGALWRRRAAALSRAARSVCGRAAGAERLAGRLRARRREEEEEEKEKKQREVSAGGLGALLPSLRGVPSSDRWEPSSQRLPLAPRRCPGTRRGDGPESWPRCSGCTPTCWPEC